MASGLSLGEVQGLIRSPRAARITLRAPIAGHVVARDVVLGQVIEPTTTAFQIADPARVWVLLEVFERDLARVAVGDSAELETDAQPGLRHRGHVMHIATSVDDSTRTARVRIEVENPDGALRPGQFVRARLRAGEAAGRAVVAVPRGAVVQVEGRPAAFVAVSEGEFELRTLELGVADGDDLEVLRGVDAGEVLVVRGSFALKSELLR
jgi:RND family efflux transporter MFP subunit